MSTACRSCGAPIIWAVHQATGSRMPLDPGYVDSGPRFTIDLTGQAHTVSDPNTTGHPSHFATCPQAGQHRRSR